MALINHTSRSVAAVEQRNFALWLIKLWLLLIRLPARPAFPLGDEWLVGGFGSRERRSQRADYSSAAGNNTPQLLYLVVCRSAVL